MKRLLGLLMAVMVMMGGISCAVAENANPLVSDWLTELKSKRLIQIVEDEMLRRFPMVDCLLNHLWRTQKRRHTTTLSCLLKKAVCFAHQQVDLRTWQNRQPIGKPF